MPFLQLTIPVVRADPAPYEDALLLAGASSITLQDAEDRPILEPAPGTTPLWPSVRISALFDSSIDAEQVLATLRAELSQPLDEARFDVVADRVWEREWLKDFRPMRFGRRLWICPGGQRPAAADAAESCLIELDPGLAFGTGTHATTALCLEWLDGADLADRRVIDYGCGSGVLAVAALKLGAARVIATDIDPQALLATRANATRNGVEGRLTICMPSELGSASAEILLANILAEPLDELAPAFAERVAVGGRLVLSGILRGQAAAVATRYAPWFDIAPAIVRDEWARLDGVRRAR
jgi:ribosomal protein L11 methyltransferase